MCQGHPLCTTTTEPTVRPLLSPHTLEPKLCNRRSRCDEKPSYRNEEEPPLAATGEKSLHSNEDPAQPEGKKN